MANSEIPAAILSTTRPQDLVSRYNDLERKALSISVEIKVQFPKVPTNKQQRGTMLINNVGHRLTRRFTIVGSLAVATTGRAWGDTSRPPGFKTGADLDKAESEGEVVFYTHDSDAAGAAIAAAFTADFPKIKASYFRLQNGALFSKLLAERSAGRYGVDVIQFSEEGTAIDFMKRGGYEKYDSPQMQFYSADNKSDPAGEYFYSGVLFAGIAYNTDRVAATDAPKTWKDLLNPAWRNSINAKQATSGMQFVQWYELRKLYGDKYWTEFAKQRPKGFDSRAQLWDRLSKGDDKVCALAEYAGYLLFKARGAPIAFVAPPDGMPATPVCAGLVSHAPHPQAGRLFLDWLASDRGQALYQTNPYLSYASVKQDVPPMPDGKRLTDYKLLFPKDMAAYTASHGEFVKEWNGMMGL